MPNWIEGTMKLRGEKNDIKRFFLEGLNFYDKPVAECIKISYEDEDGFEVELIGKEVNPHLNPHIFGTHRAFVIESETIYVYNGNACFNIQQAWDFLTENFVELAKTYNLAIRLFGIERGMEFAREIEISKTGDVVIDKKITYDDFVWECPFPNLGG